MFVQQEISPSEPSTVDNNDDVTADLDFTETDVQEPQEQRGALAQASNEVCSAFLWINYL